MSDLAILTNVLGYPVEDAQRAMLRAGGDVNRAAEILLEGGLRRRNNTQTATPAQGAGPSRALPTPPSTASPATMVIDSSESEDEGDQTNSAYTPQTPTPAARVTAPTTSTNITDDSEHESETEDPNDDLYTPPTPAANLAYHRATEPTHTHIHTHINVSTPAQFHVPNNNTTFDEGAQCVCTLPNNDEMVCCANCHRWFHYECAHLTPSTIPAGDWYCHFEPNPSTQPYNNSGNRMNELESRALYLTVTHFAPLGRHFWENVSAYMHTQFNILRSVTSVKMEWLRYSSAWFGFDERNCIQYREQDTAARKALFRSSQKDVAQPPLLWKYLGMPIPKPGEEPQEEKKPRKARVLNKPASKPKAPKRKRVIIPDDTESEDELPAPKVKRTKVTTTTPALPPTVGGKWVGSEEVFTTPAPQSPQDHSTILEAQEKASPNAYFGSAAVGATAFVGGRNTEYTPVFETDDVLLRTTYPTDYLDPYWCGGNEAILQQSRFEALAEHRRYVKDLLKDIEPNLDWAETFPSQQELLW